MSKAEALKQIEHLFSEAELVFPNKARANRYVKLARKLAMKVNLRLPSKLKRRFCKYCYSYLKPGHNLTVRTSGGKLIYHCHECNKVWKMSLGKP